jgi:hypothetical protein
MAPRKAARPAPASAENEAREAILLGGGIGSNATLNSGNNQDHEREIYSGRHLLGVVRETVEGEFVAVIDEQVLGVFGSITEATDAVLDTARQVSP